MKHGGNMTEAETRYYRSDNTSQDNDDEVTIDLGEIWHYVRKHIIQILIPPVVCAVATALVSMFLIAPKYSSTATLYLTPMVSEQGDVDYTSLQTNTKLVNNVVALLTQDNILDKAAKDNGFEDADYMRKNKIVTVTNQNGTELIDVTVTTTDAQLSADTASDIVNIFIDTMQDNLNVRNIEVVTPAKVNPKKVSPSIRKNALIGGLVGLVISLAYAVIAVITDKRLKTKDEAEKFLGVPVLCQLPVLDDNK